MPLSYADVREVLETLERVRDYEFVEITMGEFVLRGAKTAATVAQLQLSASSAPEPPPAVADTESISISESVADKPVGRESISPAVVEVVPEGMIAVCSPMAGIFYITPGPGEEAFVTEGSDAGTNETICLVEVMKLFNSVKAPVAGRVHKILAVHAEPVEHEQILMIIDPQQIEGDGE